MQAEKEADQFLQLYKILTVRMVHYTRAVIFHIETAKGKITNHKNVVDRQERLQIFLLLGGESEQTRDEQS